MTGFAGSHDDFRQPCAHADIGATHSLLVSDFASFNTLGVVDGRVEAIAVDGDKVFVGETSLTEVQVLGYAYWATRNTFRCNK